MAVIREPQKEQSGVSTWSASRLFLQGSSDQNFHGREQSRGALAIQTAGGASPKRKHFFGPVFIQFGLVKEQPLGACKISSFGQASSKAVSDHVQTSPKGPFDQGQYIPNDADQIILSGASRTLEDSGISCFSHFYVVVISTDKVTIYWPIKLGLPKFIFQIIKFINKSILIKSPLICVKEKCAFLNTISIWCLLTESSQQTRISSDIYRNVSGMTELNGNYIPNVLFWEK